MWLKAQLPDHRGNSSADTPERVRAVAIGYNAAAAGGLRGAEVVPLTHGCPVGLKNRIFIQYCIQYCISIIRPF